MNQRLFLKYALCFLLGYFVHKILGNTIEGWPWENVGGAADNSECGVDEPQDNVDVSGAGTICGTWTHLSTEGITGTFGTSRTETQIHTITAADVAAETYGADRDHYSEGDVLYWISACMGGDGEDDDCCKCADHANFLGGDSPDTCIGSVQGRPCVTNPDPK